MKINNKYIKQFIETSSRNLWLLVLIAMTFSVSDAYTQNVSFNASVTKRKVGQFEKFRIDFVINKKAEKIIPPDFTQFAFLGGPSTSVSQSWINGKSSFKKTYSYFLMPRRIGTFKIGSAKIKVDGITYRTKPLTIQVVKDVPKSDNPNDPAALASKSIYLKLVLSDATPYVNQQITATYYLYFNKNISTPQTLKMPKYNGFWSQDYEMPNRYNIEKKYINDEQFNRITLKKTILIPQKSGKLVLEPLTLEVPMEISTGKLDFFGNPHTSQYNYTVSTGKRTLNVKSLPVSGKPQNFSGAVGKYKFNISASKTTVEANESITIKATVNGVGNVKLFNLPKLTVPEELEIYDPKHTEKVKLRSEGMTGSVTEEYIIIPRYKGTYKLPQLEFSYFDVKKEKYITIKGDSFSINVTKGAKSLRNNSSSNSSINKSKVQLLGKDIRFIHTKTEFIDEVNNTLFGSFLYYILLVIPFLTIPMIMFIYHKKRKANADVVGSRKRKAGKMAKKMLSESRDALKADDESKFYEAVINALYKYLAFSLNIEQSKLSKTIISELLVQKGADEIQVSTTIKLLSDCEMARYAPSANKQSLQDIYNDASSLISGLEKLKK